MRKVFVLLFLCSLMMISFSGAVYSQDEDTSATEEMTSDTGMAEEAVAEEPVVEEPEPPAEEAIEEPVIPEAKGHQLIKKYFIEGGAGFMGIVLLCLIIGLAFAIERIIRGIHRDHRGHASQGANDPFDSPGYGLHEHEGAIALSVGFGLNRLGFAGFLGRHFGFLLGPVAY